MGFRRASMARSMEMSVDRRAMKALAVLSSLTFAVAPVNAAQYGGFGKAPTAVLQASDVVISEVTENAKTGKANLDKFVTSVRSIRSTLKSDAQADLVAPIKANLNPATLRDALNKYNTAFDEASQKGTDRLIRVALQDITELQREVVMKDGKIRADSKVSAIDKRLAALEDALTTLCDYTKGKF